MNIKCAVKDLIPGMYVSDLDRPWEETPFMFQGFVIDTQEDLSILRKTCRFVFVETEESKVDERVQQKLHDVVDSTVSVPIEIGEWHDLERIRTTVRELNRGSADVARRLKDLVRTSTGIDRASIEETRRVVGDLVEAIAANPKASAWLRILGEQDEDNSRHGISTGVLSVGFVRRLHWDVEWQEIVGQGAIFHDVGMTRVSARIRHKPGELTELERRVIETHPAYAARLMEQAGGFDARVIDIVKHHHECQDGSGYPDHLSGGQIESSAQLVAICSFYDLHTTPQPYRSAELPSVVLDHLLARAGRHFDQELVEEFIRWVGIYPLGSLLALRNGTLAVVVASNERHRLRPTVLLVRDRNGRAILPRRLMNLEFMEWTPRLQQWSIESVVDPMQVGIDIRGILRQELQFV